MQINGYEIGPGANLHGADLHSANLYGVDLRGANLCGADLHDAYLCGADLRSADLHDANLCDADLHDANLCDADLRVANLRDANLRSANLHGANLRDANLHGANLRDANLHGADLHNADLHNADLRSANLHGAKNVPSLVSARLLIAPEGEIIGWKKLAGGTICKLLIPAEAKRNNATGRKCRAEYAVVLEGEGRSRYDCDFRYTAGETVRPRQPFDEDRWNECGSGIHFFLTREEAEVY